MKSNLSATTRFPFLTPENIAAAKIALDETGYLLMPDGVAADFCASAIHFIDHYRPEGTLEQNYGGTEVRIWSAEKLDASLGEFTAASDAFVSDVEGQPIAVEKLLAIRNLAVDASNPALMKGRWHLDSFRRQLKVFVFLTDTTEESGPFEFIPSTHRGGFKLKALSGGQYIKFQDLFGPTRKYQSLNDDWVDDLDRAGFPSKPVLCRAGTVMIIDTSAVHRARPCTKGSRYALTAYYK